MVSELPKKTMDAMETNRTCPRGHTLTSENVYEETRVGTFKTSKRRICRKCVIDRVKKRRERLTAEEPGHRERESEAQRTSRRRTAAEVAHVRGVLKAKRAADRVAARAARQEADLTKKAASARPRTEARRSDPATNWRDHLKNKYGLTVADYDRMLLAQSGACAACTTPMTRGNPNADNAPHVDHCHATRQVRGILCRRCNLAVGLLRDDPIRARSVAAYLERGR